MASVRLPGALFIACCLLSAAAAAQEPNGLLRPIQLVDRDGAATRVGTLRLQRDGDAYRYEVQWDETLFSDQFLSMRPFRCLGGDEQMWCRLAYPYPLERRIRAADLTDLEYDLLFIRKHGHRFGADFWDGVYYRLAGRPGESIEGTVRAADMNLLASPPETPGQRLIGEGDLHEVAPDNYRFPGLVIGAPGNPAPFQ